MTLISFAMLVQAQPVADTQMLPRLLFTFVPLMLIFWFLLIRPQRKLQQKHMEVIQSLKKGDEVITDGGIIGQIVHLTDDRVTIRTGENTRIVLVRGKIARVVPPQLAAEAKE